MFWVINIIELLPARSKLLQRVEHRRAAKGQIPARRARDLIASLLVPTDLLSELDGLHAVEDQSLEPPPPQNHDAPPHGGQLPDPTPHRRC